MSRRNVREIPGGLKVGAQIIVRGRVPEGSGSFAINLQRDRYTEDGIAFHFNPRIDDQIVVRNSYQSGWENEERDSPYFPFQSGGSFSVRIHVGTDYYTVMVNNWDFIQFHHRIPFEDVRFVVLGEGAEYYESTIQNPARVPYSMQFRDPFYPGSSVRVRGVVNDDAEGFIINFSLDDNEDNIALHFNPRQEEDTVVLNTKAGDWQDEQREGQISSFHRGQLFDIFFIALEDRFNVYVNENYFTSYNHRIGMQDIRFLSVHGDIALMDVQCETPLPGDFVEEIPSGLEAKDRVVVKGFFYPEAERFAINLLYGTSMDDDIGLHFNPRRGEDEVVFNSRDGGDWREEERHALPSIFRDQVPFTVEFVTKENKFKVYVNGRKLASFRARGNVADIRGINVNGEAYFYDVQVLKNVANPFVSKVPATVTPGSWVQVIGTPAKKAEGFALNLQCGSGIEGPDVAFHFNPRFDGAVCVRNTLENGSWGEEERDQPDFPFKPKDTFVIHVLRREGFFRVFVNGRFYVDYAHRIEPERICHLLLKGDCYFFEPEYF